MKANTVRPHCIGLHIFKIDASPSPACCFFVVDTPDSFLDRPEEKRKLSNAASDVISVMRTALTKDEFANALGMRPDEIFVKKMFKIVDKDQDGRISFQVRKYKKKEKVL